MIELLQPHWKTMGLALIAVLGETVTDLLEPWPGKTCVVIAHHLATIQKADVIFVVKDFQIAEHTELLAAGGVYAELYELPLGSAVPPWAGK